nr:PAS domain S-box protein [Chelatococcus sp. YT9]
MTLRSPLPIVTLWGEDGIMIYNDAYSVFAGARHPSLLGSKVREGWPEVADFNDNIIKTVFRHRRTLSYQDQKLTLDRGHGPQPAWLDLAYSPVVAENGTSLGVIAIVVETTDRILTDRQLQDERIRLRQMYEQSASFMALLEGPEYRFALVNAAYQSLVGGREVIGRTVADALPEAIAQGYGDLLDRVYHTGKPHYAHSAPFDLLLSEGTSPERRYVDFIYQPISDTSGRVTGIFVNGIDVTESVAAQEALRTSEARFRTFAQAMPNQVWTSRGDGLLDWFNDQVCTYSGRTPEELAGKGWIDIVHPDDRAKAAQVWRDALASADLFETEYRLRRVDGDYRWHLARALPIRNDAGAITQWIGTNTEIHEQKLTEAATSRNLERIWNLSPVLKVIASPSGKISAVNPAWTRTLGWTAEETVGRNILRFVARENRHASAGRLRKLSSSPGMIRSESPIRAKDGTRRQIAWTTVLDAGTIYGFGRDITAEVEAAAALAKSEAALLQAQKMEAIGQLTGGIAHDFNNLLQVVGGNLQLLAKDVEGNEKAGRRVRNAIEGVNRGSRLSSQLLAFGRRQPLAPKVVNLARLIRDMDEMLRRALGEAIEVETIVGGGLWNTLVDPGQVENALLNLAINARDAMEGRGKLTIETGNAFLDDLYARDHADVTPGQYVMMAVTDTGSGIPPDVIGKVFDPFFTTKSEGKGSGLGLSMVYGFIKQSGGHIKIYSEIGEGTTVKLYLPRSTQKEDGIHARDAGPVTGGEETILVAEDDAAVRQTVVETLSGLGYRVLQASDAAAALAILESGIHIDLLFTDVVMPGSLKSTELAKRAIQRLPNLKVLFTSGYTENAIVHGGRLDEGVELLSKPYTREALAWKLRDLLGGPVVRDVDHTQGGRENQPLAARPSLDAAPGALLIVVCEDEALIRISLVDMLEELGHRVLEAENASTALALLAANDADVLMTDVGLPDMNGIALVEEARKMREDLSIVVATGHSHLEGLDAVGKIHVLSKPFDRGQLAEVISELCVTRPRSDL